MTHMFALRCREHGIEHRFTKINHPWTNGQVERMNRTIKDATVKRYHYDDHDQLRRHLADFVAAYNFARRLKTLKGLTPFDEYRSKAENRRVQAERASGDRKAKWLDLAGRWDEAPDHAAFSQAPVEARHALYIHL